MQNLKRRGGQSLLPFGQPVGESEIRVEKMTAWPQHARDFCQKAREVRITMGCLHVDHRVESGRLKREIFGVALLENEAVQAVSVLAEADGGGIQNPAQCSVVVAGCG